MSKDIQTSTNVQNVKQCQNVQNVKVKRRHAAALSSRFVNPLCQAALSIATQALSTRPNDGSGRNVLAASQLCLHCDR